MESKSEGIVVSTYPIYGAQERWRLDYRDLNRASPKDDFPLPHIDILVDNVAGMDGFSRYNKSLLDEEDREKTAFTTPFK